ncbi:prolyl endopeptidase-like protein [Tanacetum coccineum]
MVENASANRKIDSEDDELELGVKEIQCREIIFTLSGHSKKVLSSHLVLMAKQFAWQGSETRNVIVRNEKKKMKTVQKKEKKMIITEMQKLIKDKLNIYPRIFNFRLEDPDSKEVKEFVKKQVELTVFVLKKCEMRERLHDKLTKSYEYPNFGAPFREVDKYFYIHNSGLQLQKVMYMHVYMVVELYSKVRLEMFHCLLTRKVEEQFNYAGEVSGVVSLIKDSQANSNISPQDNNYIGVNDRLVTVIGTLQQLMQAVNLIPLKLSEDSYYAVSKETRKILIERADNFNMALNDVSIASPTFGRECMAAIEAKQMVAHELENVR